MSIDFFVPEIPPLWDFSSIFWMLTSWKFASEHVYNLCLLNRKYPFPLANKILNVLKGDYFEKLLVVKIPL